MSYAIETARVRIGLPKDDASKDELLDPAMAAALTLAETYCDRGFLLASVKERAIHFVGRAIQLFRYPIKEVSGVTSDGSRVPQYHIEANTGRLVGDGLLAGHEVVVEYEGGYESLPADLEMALWLIFDAVWPNYSGAGAASAITGVSSISVPDVGTLRFSADGGASGGGGGAEYGLLPLSAVAILNLYRRVLC